MDRNRKTTVNIQEGLPFSIDDMRRQIEDKNLVARIKEIAQKYNGMGRMCSDLHEYNIIMRYLLSVVVFSHFQRPCVAQNMTSTNSCVQKRHWMAGSSSSCLITRPVLKDRVRWRWNQIITSCFHYMHGGQSF